MGYLYSMELSQYLERAGYGDLAKELRVLASTSRDQAFRMFKEAARKVWRNSDFVEQAVSLSHEEPKGDVLASLAYAGNVRAIGDSLIVRSKHYTLRIADALLAKDETTIMKIMIHEAVHLGYPRHDADFRRLVREHGGAVSESATGDDSIKVQMKKGSRFETIKTFDDEHEAMKWAKEQMKINPGKYRMIQ